MLTRPQGVLGEREIGLHWLRRARKAPEGDKQVGGTRVCPCTQQVGETVSEKSTKEVENNERRTRTERRQGDQGRLSHHGGARARRVRQEPASGDGCILRTDQCTIRFGGLVAVNSLDMDVRRGEIYGLIGPNGAGKTTVFNLLTGVYKPTSRRDLLSGPAHRRPQVLRDRAARRLAHVPEHPPLPRHDRARERHDRLPPARAVRPSSTPSSARRASRATSASIATSRLELLEIFDLARFKDEGGDQPPLRQPAPSGDRPRAGHAPATAAARRAGGGDEPLGAGRS